MDRAGPISILIHSVYTQLHYSYISDIYMYILAQTRPAPPSDGHMNACWAAKAVILHSPRSFFLSGPPSQSVRQRIWIRVARAWSGVPERRGIGNCCLAFNFQRSPLFFPRGFVKGPNPLLKGFQHLGIA